MDKKTKVCIGSCGDNPFNSVEKLDLIVENAREITKRTFLKYCCVHPDYLSDMKKFPHDYEFFKYRNIYFYTWSAIEYFYE